MSDSDTPEVLITAMSTHWVKYLMHLIFCHAMAFVAFLILFLAFVVAEFSGFISLALFFVSMVMFMYTHHVWFHKVMSEELLDIFLTSHRIIYFDDRLFLCDNEHEIPIHKVASVDVEQVGLLKNILNYGTIRIDTGGGAVDLRRTIANVPHPEELAEKITRMTS